MVNYTSQYQSKLEAFGNIHHLKLNPSNRWVKLAHTLPWDMLVKIYSKKFSSLGSRSINPRVVIGSFIVKHKLNLSDDETLDTISENPYIQYFLGFDEFISESPFSPTSLVEIRKKVDKEIFDEFSDVLIKVCFPNRIKSTDETLEYPNKGHLKLDATVADQYIKYPNDLGLLNEGRIKTELIIDFLYERNKNLFKVKPRTYRKVAHTKYLTEAKKRQKNKKSLRSAIRYLLNCLDRNIRSINRMMDTIGEVGIPYKMLRNFWIIQTLNDQQRKMYDEKSNRCENRIVSIHQPHVRPIVRGKQGKKVEFGSKLGLSLANGFVKAGTLSWDAYNESKDLINHTEAYKAFYGYYPELIQVDKIYGTNENRAWCKARNIRLTVSAKGPKPTLTAYQKKKAKKEYSQRNQIEGKIGQAKQGYRLNQVKAKLKDTSQSWIALILFVTNIAKFAEIQGFYF